MIQIRDAQGNVVTGDSTTSVTVSIASGTGGTLGGTATITAASGVVTFTDLTLAGTAGESYVLEFAASGLTSAIASQHHGHPRHGDDAGGLDAACWRRRAAATLATQPVVQIRDAQGNVVTGDSTTSVTVSIASGTGGTLGGTATVTAASGVVTFTDLTLAGTVGESYVLEFAASGLTSASRQSASRSPPARRRRWRSRRSLLAA